MLTSLYSEVITPIPPLVSHKNLKLSSGKLSCSYREAIGKLLFVANCTRLDIAFAVNYLGRYQETPQEVHWTLLNRLFVYLTQTSKYGLLYECTNEVVDAFADSDFSGDKMSKSTTGYIVRFFGCPVAWASRLQSCVAESSGEAENTSICAAAHDILFLVRLTEEIFGKSYFPVTLYEDSNTAIGFCTKHTSKSRLKHVMRKYYKSKEYVNDNLLKIVKIGSKNQKADLLTKGLPKETFIQQRNA